MEATANPVKGKGKRRKPYVSVTDRLAAKAAPSKSSVADAALTGESAVKAPTAAYQPLAPAGQAVNSPVGKALSLGNGKRRSEGGGGGGGIRSAKAAGKGKPKAVPVAPIVEAVMQPKRKAYGGMGLARPSEVLILGTSGFMERFLHLYHEHVDGFTGKAFAKARRREMSQGMLWRVKLREKHGAAAKSGVGLSSSSEAPTDRSASHVKAAGDAGLAGKRKRPKSKQRLAEAVAHQRAQNPNIKVDETQRLRAIELYRQQKKLNRSQQKRR